MRKGQTFFELFLIIAAGILLGAFVIDHLFMEADAAVPVIHISKIPEHLEIVLGGSLGAGNYNVNNCRPICNDHINSTDRWGMKAQLVTMRWRKARNFDLGLELGVSNTLNANLDKQGGVNDRIIHIVPIVRVPMYKNPDIAGNINLYGGVGVGWVKTRFAMNDNDVHTDHGNALVALGGIQILLSKHVTLAFQLEHDDLGNAAFRARRDCEKPRSLSLDRTINTASAVFEWHI